MIHLSLGIVAFEVLPRENNVDGFKGKKLNLEWELINIPTGYKINYAVLTYNATYKISRYDPIKSVPILSLDASQLFHNRISITLSGKIYKVTLTNLLFNDTGIYQLVVQITKSVFDLPRISSGTINVSSVIGSCRYFYLQIFKYHFL